ncbi:ATP-binding protein [Roseomonas gilardii]|uniref:BbrUII/HgiDII family restriction enzyme n=1 Tax=Roseomonas gilardii TaxID=257708 RepID=UPI00119E56C9|nr:ATP-binding protein [Roseomonas gilardii]
MKDGRFHLTVSLNVLEHLGINLYSNVPSVLSEIVANAWDADAGRVRIRFDRIANTFVIQDDGTGMTADEVNERFLMVGHRRRDIQPGQTAKGRMPMGRKGIGKLSLFSIASTVTIETAKDGEKNAFRMELAAIRDEIRRAGGQGTYRPVEIPTSSIDFPQGTRITLTNLRRRQTIATSNGLRRRVARRFTVIDDPSSFVVEIDGQPVTAADRDYYGKLQYLWTYGDQSAVEVLATGVERAEARQAPQGVTGWLATVRESGQLKDDEGGENLNRIAVFVRGKMAQEDILGDFSERGVFAGYLLGELRADGFDTYDGPGTPSDDDAATSSRQKLVEDDPRYNDLKNFLAAELKYIQNRWSDQRSEAGAREAMKIPEVDEWVASLKPPIRKRAKAWLGKINLVRTDDPNERKQLIKHAVLGFEFYRLHDNLDAIEAISTENLSVAMALFQELDGLEANLYGQIVQQRIAVIKTLRERVANNALEKAIQEFLFNHLWLLDPSWERVEGTEVMETNVRSMLDGATAELSDEERRGRLDIGYRKAAGQNIIIELKRANRVMSRSEMLDQADKYGNGLRKLLTTANRQNEGVEIVFVLGSLPREWGDPQGQDRLTQQLRGSNARIVFYNELLENAEKSYGDYLKHKGSLDILGKVIAAIDDYAPSITSAAGNG